MEIRALDGNLEAGTNAEAIEKYCLLACTASLISPIIQDHLSRGVTMPSNLGPPISIINHENVP